MDFTWFASFTEQIRMIEDPSDRLAIYEALTGYALTREVPELEYPLNVIFAGMRKDVDNSIEARHSNKGGRPRKGASARRENGGSDGGKPGFSEEETTVPESENLNQAKPSQAKPGQSKGEGRVRFSPPTPGDVDAYAKERGIDIDAERFCDFYASKGWRVGSSPMKDWRAAARNWAARDRGKETGNADLGEYSGVL